MTFPNAASVNYVSDWGFRRDAVQVSAQVTITMAGYKSILNQSESVCPMSPKAITANVSKAVAKISGASPIVLVVIVSYCLPADPENHNGR